MNTPGFKLRTFNWYQDYNFKFHEIGAWWFDHGDIFQDWRLERLKSIQIQSLNIIVQTWKQIKMEQFESNGGDSRIDLSKHSNKYN